MPQVSRFHGIAISMYFSDHGPPHFHADSAEYSAKVEIATGEICEGELTRRDARLVRWWAKLHVRELEDNWMRARANEALVKIEPLP